MTPTMLDLADAYRGEGLRVLELPGWKARGHSAGPMTPRGGGWHHTADNLAVISVFNANGPDIRPDVPQPRANVWVPRDGDHDLVLVAAGTAYHFGKGSRTALKLAWDGKVTLATPDAAIVQYPDDLDDTAPGNDTMIGHEVQNLGTGQPLTTRQLWAIPRIAAAECRLFSWGPGHHMHHRQYTRRKPDMAWRGDLWSLTGAVLEGDTMTPAEMTVAAKAGAAAALAEAFGRRYDPNRPGDPADTLREFLDAAPEMGAQVKAAADTVTAMAGELRALRAQVDALAAAVGGAK
jgi:hypothetical protein